ncbi:MAG: hypothetical protein CMJ83_12825 [Planctomycetes bacterium]|nr:hypothetical protein [Planctomycetota bacterium]
MQRWSQRLASCVEGVGLILALGGAFAAGTRAGIGIGIGVFLFAYALVAIGSFLVRIAMGMLEYVGRGLSALFCPGPRTDPLAAWPGVKNLRVEPAATARGVRFYVPGDPDAPSAPPLSPTDRIDDHARKAVGTLDLLTRRPLDSGDPVFLCLGQHGACGAAFHRDIRADLRLHYGDKCPSCGTVSAYVYTVLPKLAPTPPPLSTAAVASEGPSVPGVENPASSPPPESVVPASHDAKSRGLRPLVFRTAS